MAERQKKILIVDDERDICDLVCTGLSLLDYYCESAGSDKEVQKALKNKKFDVLLLDIRLPGKSGMEILNDIRSTNKDMIVIMLTAVNDLETAVKAMKLGASDYITKPFTMDRIDEAIKASFDKNGQKAEMMDEAIADIEAIALGVEARQEMMDIHTERILQQTVNLAHQMGISDEKIRLWQQWRSNRNRERVKPVTDSISRLIEDHRLG